MNENWRIVKAETGEDIIKVSANPPSDEDFSVATSVDMQKKSAIFYELISDGLGVLFSREHGSVLFHLDNLYIDGSPASYSDVASLTRGDVRSFVFVAIYATDPKYSVISPTNTIQQAIAVWRGKAPQNLDKFMETKAFVDDLKEHREHMVQLAQEGCFTELAMMRVKGRIVCHFEGGRYGVIELTDGPHQGAWVMFKKEDAFVFRRRLESQDDLNYCLPINLKVSLDCIKVTEPSDTLHVLGIDYQAVVVLAGTWPELPHPTALTKRGENGTYAPKFEGTHSFYYLSRDIGWQLTLKQKDFHRTCFGCETLSPLNSEIRGARDFQCWYETFSARPFKHRKFDRNRNKMLARSTPSHYFGKINHPKSAVVHKIEIKKERPIKTEKASNKESVM